MFKKNLEDYKEYACEGNLILIHSQLVLAASLQLEGLKHTGLQILTARHIGSKKNY